MYIPSIRDKEGNPAYVWYWQHTPILSKMYKFEEYIDRKYWPCGFDLVCKRDSILFRIWLLKRKESRSPHAG